ncbi:hypothetical protein YC2023_114332 [Brassica napus]
MFLVRMESIELNYKRIVATFTAEKICTGCSNVYPRYHCSNRLLSTYSGSKPICLIILLLYIDGVQDIPDTEGDKILELNGLKQNETLFLKYMRFGHVVCHVLLATTLWTRAKSVDLSSKTEITSCYMFIWKLFYAEYLLLSFFEVNIRREEGRSHYYPYVYLFRQDHEIR